MTEMGKLRIPDSEAMDAVTDLQRAWYMLARARRKVSYMLYNQGCRDEADDLADAWWEVDRLLMGLGLMDDVADLATYGEKGGGK